MKKEKNKKSRIIIEFDNPEARAILRSCILVHSGMTFKGKICQMLGAYLTAECGKNMKEVEEILGYKF